MIPVILDLGKKLCNTGLRPVATNDGQYVSQHVGLSDRAVDVGNDNFVGPLPEVQVAAAAGRALVCGCHAELNFVHARQEVQTVL